MKVPSLKTGQMMTIAYGIAIIVVLFIVYKILAGVGLIKTPAKKRAEAEKGAAVKMLRTDDYFDPLYIKTNNLTGQFKSLGSNAPDVYARDIFMAIQGWGTNEEAIYSTFGKLHNKCNISEIAMSYNLKYRRSLQADLLNDLTDSEVSALMNIINGLPNK